MSGLLFTFVQNTSYMFQFICLGSGSSGNCYCLFTEDDGVMIDAGLGIRALKKSFKEYGLSMSKIHSILITHDHADHVKSAGKLSADYRLPVYATDQVHAGIEQNFCVRQKIALDRRYQIKKGTSMRIGDFRITSFSVPHDSHDNVGYKIEYDGISFGIMTDIGFVTDEMKTVIGEVDYLVIEANYDEEMLLSGPYPQHLKARITGPNGHLGNTDCAVALAENSTDRLKHVWLCHLSEENNHPELARKTIEQTLRSYGVIAGKDFLLDVLKRKKPSLLYELGAEG